MFKLQLSKFKIKKFEREIEPQEILLDSLAQKKEKEMGVSGRRLEFPLSQKILRGFWFLFLVLIFVLLARTFQLNVLEGEALVQLSEENKFAIRLIQAGRGVIYDENLKQLVSNKPSFDFVCDGEVVEENLEHEALIFYEVRIKEFPGCEIKNNTVREYSSDSFFSHLIGYQRKTGESTGLEGYYNEVLKPKPGEIQIERDVHGNPISKEIVAMPQSGQSLVLNLDSELQEKLSQALAKSVRNTGASAGVAVALNPQNGGVLALVNFPSFNANLFSQGITEEQWQEIESNPSDPLFNRAVAGSYLTGSTIKPLIASAVLEEGLINPDKSIYCGGGITIPNPWIANASTTKADWAVHGWTDMRKALAESCNVYFYTVGGGYENQEGLGPTRIKKYLELFGWGDKTGIDLPGEVEGFLPDKDWKKETWGQSWWDGDTYNLAIGQGFLQITPLEVANSFAAIANGGTLYQPQVVKQIIDEEKRLVEEIESEIIRRNFIDPVNLQIIREGMRQAVTGFQSPHASAVVLSSLPVKAAAKTGTAELGNDFYHNWVTVFAPYDNPQIVLTIMIEKVKGGQVAALPVAQEVLNWYFSR